MLIPAYNLTATERVLPRLALDFTTAALDSRVTLTRALDTATRINSNGYIETVNANLPRFDFTLNTGGACKGLLIEEARTNVLTYSSGFDNAIWVAETGITKVGYAADVVGPDGVLGSAYELTIASGTSGNGLKYNTSVATLGLTTHAATVYVRAKDTPVKLRIWASGNSASSDITVTTAWTRIENVTADTAGFVRIISLPGAAGDGGNVYLYGAQAENGAFATSYIPTTTTSLTRNADAVTMTGTNFSDWYNATEGTLSFEGSVFVDQGATTVNFLQISDNASNNYAIDVGMFGASAPLFQVKDGTTQASIDVGTLTVGSVFKLLGAYKLNSFAGAINGGTPQTDPSGTIPAGMVQMGIGTRLGGPYMNGHARKVAYWPQRLINAEVQAFSK